MKRVKEFSIKITEGDSCPIVKIDGEEVPHIAKVKLCFESENAIGAPWENGFFIEFFDINDGRGFKRILGQSFRV